MYEVNAHWARRRPPRVWAAVVVLVGGLAMIALAAAFAMVVVWIFAPELVGFEAHPPQSEDPTKLNLVVGGFALASFGTGMLMISIAVRGLRRIMSA